MSIVEQADQDSQFPAFQSADLPHRRTAAWRRQAISARGYVGLSISLGILTGAIEVWGRFHTPALVLFPFTALTNTVAFLLMTAGICIGAAAFRQAWIARAGSGLVVALALGNLLRSAAFASMPKEVALSIAGIAGLIWIAIDQRTRRFFDWTTRTDAGILTVLVAAIPACIYGGDLAEWRHYARLGAAPASAPNVLLVIADTVRADHLSSYGYARPTTPAVDALARQGVRFDRAIAASSWTLPSHTSMLTGRYPHDHGAVLPGGGYDGRFPTLPEYLSQSGYRTAAFSANPFFFSRAVGLGQGFVHFVDDDASFTGMLAATHIFSATRARLVRMGLMRSLVGRQAATDISNAALAWIASTDTRRPFFVTLNYFDAHDPYDPPEPQRSRFARSQTPARNLSMSDNVFPGEMSEADWQQEIDLYDGGIDFIDEQIRRLTAELDRRGILQNTLLVITSDHGESFGEHGTILHASSLYFQQVHVPLIVRWPGHVPAGAIVRQSISTASLASTIAMLATGRTNPSFSAPSLDALWNNPRIAWPAPVSELARFPLDPRFRNYKESLRSVTTDDWYRVTGESTPAETYDADDRRDDNASSTAVESSYIR